MAKRIPSLNWLRVFEAAARTGSFARAAERLSMSPPAVSQQIRALEDHLGRRLFDRAAAGVTLTETGRSLLVVVGESIGRMEAAAETLANPRGPPLVIGVSLMFSAGWLAPRLFGFQDAYPDITLQIQSLVGHPERPSRDAALWVAFGQPPPGTDSVPLFGEQLVPVATPDIAATIAHPTDMLSHTLIEVSDHRKNWAQVLGVDVLPAHAKILHVDTTLTALALASAGCGLALARPPASDHLVGRYGLVPCIDGLAVPGVETYHLLSATGARLSADAHAFQTWLLDEVTAAGAS